MEKRLDTIAEGRANWNGPLDGSQRGERHSRVQEGRFCATFPSHCSNSVPYRASHVVTDSASPLGNSRCLTKWNPP